MNPIPEPYFLVTEFGTVRIIPSESLKNPELIVTPGLVVLLNDDIVPPAMAILNIKHPPAVYTSYLISLYTSRIYRFWNQLPLLVGTSMKMKVHLDLNTVPDRGAWDV